MKEKKPKYINPFTDYGFKLLFATEANASFLIDFLNSVLELPAPIQEIQYKNGELLPDLKDERKAIFDIFCTDTAGNQFVVEMQKGRLTHFKDRALFYSTFPFRADAKKGEWNYELQPVYYLAILDFLYEPIHEAKFDRVVYLKDQDDDIFYKKLQLRFLQMPAFQKNVVDLNNRYDQWCYFLKHLESFEAIPSLFKLDSTFQQMISLSEIANMTAEEFQQYHISERQYRELKGIADAAREEGQAEIAVLLEQERAAKEQALAAKEQALAAKEQALAAKETERTSRIKLCQMLQKDGYTIPELLDMFQIDESTLETWLENKL